MEVKDGRRMRDIRQKRRSSKVGGESKKVDVRKIL